MKKLFFAIILLSSLSLKAEDTVKVMQYNLLNYGYSPSYCTALYDLSEKTEFLRTIVDYADADILCVNEMGANSFAVQRLLDSALNYNNNNWEKAIMTNQANSSIINMLYYNHIKFSLLSQEVINTTVRDINLYKLYYNSPDLASTNDTIFLNCIVTHLKSGSSSSDENTRAIMTSNAMAYLDNLNTAGNYLFMGDFNVKTSTEPAFQNLINHTNSTIKFYDPINEIGSWYNNSTYASVHTQSTHSSSSGCKSSGGLDDRFDFILASSNIINGIDNIGFIPGSYYAIANDGQHFNSSIISSGNTSVPSNVLDAIYNMSDHLPVCLDLKINSANASVRNTNNFAVLKVQNPFNDKIDISLTNLSSKKIHIEIYSSVGQLIFSKTYTTDNSLSCSIYLSDLSSGLFFLNIRNEFNQQIHKKMIKVN